MKKSKFNVATIAAMFSAIVLFNACQKNDSLVPSQADSELTSNGNERVAPVVPSIIEVPAGNSISFHTYATGVQIYTCTETSAGVFTWVFTAPEATLFANAGLNG